MFKINRTNNLQICSYIIVKIIVNYIIIILIIIKITVIHIIIKKILILIIIIKITYKINKTNNKNIEKVVKQKMLLKIMENLY